MNTRKRIYDFIVQFKSMNDGCAPSEREIQEGLGISSTSVVHHHLEKLELEGKIVRMPGAGTSRGIKVVGGVWRLGRVSERSG